jgi:phosphoglycolate phosphatase
VQRYSGYLFDLDGTLVDTAPDLHQALNHALTTHDYMAVDIRHTRHWIGHGARAMVTQALQAELEDEPAQATIDRARFATQLLEALDLSSYFASIVCGDTTSRAKPAADPALHACAELGLEVNEVLFVGDSTTDVDCARAAGCAVVCVRDGYNHGIAAQALGADAVIESFRDLV